MQQTMTRRTTGHWSTGEIWHDFPVMKAATLSPHLFFQHAADLRVKLLLRASGLIHGLRSLCTIKSVAMTYGCEVCKPTLEVEGLSCRNAMSDEHLTVQTKLAAVSMVLYLEDTRKIGISFINA
jgi:hypothetical protein